MQPQKHQSLIIQWANGEKIQYRKPDELVWKDSDTPAWVEDYEYRVKPKEPERAYPVTGLSNQQINKAIITSDGQLVSFRATEAGRRVADAALRHAIDAGQVVTREEFDKLAAINATLRKAMPINFD